MRLPGEEAKRRRCFVSINGEDLRTCSVTAASVLVAAKTGRERRRKGVDIGRHDRECRKAAARTGRSGWSVATAERSGRLAEGRGGDRRDSGGERRAARPAEGRGGERRDGCGGEQRGRKDGEASGGTAAASGEQRVRKDGMARGGTTAARAARAAVPDQELMCVAACQFSP